MLTQAAADSPPAPSSHQVEAEAGRRVTLNLFAVPLGFAGTGGAWSAAADLLHAPRWPGEMLCATSTALWVGFLAVYIANGARRRGVFRADLHHPLTGPFAAYVPLIAALLAVHYTSLAPHLFGYVCVVTAAALGLVAAQLVARLLDGQLPVIAIHPGYFIPLVAGPNIASIALSSANAHQAAVASFGVAVFFWVIVSIVVILRLTGSDPLPDQAKTGLSAFVAAAATSNLSWLVAHPNGPGEVQVLLTGLLAFMLLIQVFLIPVYAKIGHGFGWWTFTFPAASAANYLIRRLDAGSPLQGIFAWTALGLATLLLAYLVIRSGVTAAAQYRTERMR